MTVTRHDKIRGFKANECYNHLFVKQTVMLGFKSSSTPLAQTHCCMYHFLFLLIFYRI